MDTLCKWDSVSQAHEYRDVSEDYMQDHGLCEQKCEDVLLLQHQNYRESTTHSWYGSYRRVHVDL